MRSRPNKKAKNRETCDLLPEWSKGTGAALLKYVHIKKLIDVKSLIDKYVKEVNTLMFYA